MSATERISAMLDERGVDVCYTLASPPRGLGFDPRRH